jgi:hypothetical protein
MVQDLAMIAISISRSAGQRLGYGAITQIAKGSL